MTEAQKTVIQEWFADCLSAEEVAILYAELLCEARKQLSYMLEEAAGGTE